MKYKLLILTFALFSVSNYSYADWKVYCGQASPSISYEAARTEGVSSGSTLPNSQALYIVGLPSIISPTTGKDGVSGNVEVKCTLAQSKEIRSFKTNDRWQNYNVSGVWSPRVALDSLNQEYLLPYTGGHDNSDIGGVYTGSIRHPNGNNKWYKIANSQSTPNVFRFKPTAGIIPAGAELFKMELRGRADLPGSDEAFNVHVPVITSSEIRVLEPTCNFSTQDVIVNLKPYNVGGSTSQQVPLSIICNFGNKVDITLRGPAESSDSSILQNTSNSNPAKGIGFRITDSTGYKLRVNIPKTYTFESDKSQSLFTVDYAPIGSSTVKAGNVQSIVNIEIKYN